MEKYLTFFHKSHGSIWQGKILAGTSGAVELCLALDSEQAAIIKNRPKIKAGCCGDFFIKRYNLPGLLNQLRSYFKNSRPQIVLEAAQILEENHIATPIVVAALTQKQLFRRCDYLITEKLSPRYKVVPAWLEKNSPQICYNALIQNFIPLLVKMHHGNLCHGDLSLRNIYCDAGLSDFGVLDLDGAKKFSSCKAEKICSAEVARLVSSFALYSKEYDKAALFCSEAVKKYNTLSKIRLDVSAVAAETELFMEHGKKYIAGLA